MNIFKYMIEGVVDFVRRNPLFCLMVIMLALLAPSLLKGMALVVLYLLLGLVIFGMVILLVIRWRFRRLQKQMEEQMRGTFRGGQGGPSAGYNPYGGGSTRRPNEGEVQVHITSETPEKRVSKDVGDYVEFEETPEKR